VHELFARFFIFLLIAASGWMALAGFLVARFVASASFMGCLQWGHDARRRDEERSV